MKIRRAIRLANKSNGMIARASWASTEFIKVAIDAPHVEWTNSKYSEPWMPSADEIIAADWEVVSE